MRRAFTILSILLVVTIGALVATSSMHAADAQQALVEASIRRTRTRALAWSGVQAAMAELAAQREDLLDGAAPDLTEEWELFDLGDGRRGVVRLIPIGAAGELVESEAGKLNVNTAALNVLARVPGLDEALAQRIIDRRGPTGIASIESLADLDGVTADLLYGDPDDPESPGLVRLLTVFSADPNVQNGAGAEDDRFRGDRRININGEWSDRLGEALERRYDENLANGVKDLMEQDVDLSSESSFVAFMQQIGSDVEDWVEVLDVFAATSNQYTLGRVDLLTAPASVLAALPGFDDTVADAVVRARESLDDDSRRTVVWPVLEGVMTEVQFQLAVPHIASRSMQWRVRIEVGVLDEAPMTAVAPSEDRGPLRDDMIGGSFRGADAERDLEAPLADRMVVEAVIDVSSMRPRVAYMRDVTHLELALRLDASQADVVESDAPMVDEEPTTESMMSLADAETFNPFADDRTLDEPDDVNAELAPAEPASFDDGEDNRIGRWTTGGDS